MSLDFVETTRLLFGGSAVAYIYFGRQMIRPDYTFRRQSENVFYYIFKFAYISQIIQVHQDFHGFRGDAGNLLVLKFIKLMNKMIYQQGYIFFSFAKRRDVDLYDVYSIIQILSEFSLLDQPFDIFIGGRDNPGLRSFRLDAAQRLEYVILKDSE